MTQFDETVQSCSLSAAQANVGDPTWTDDRVEDLKRMWSQGLSGSQIAKGLGLGITRNAVIGKVHRLNLAGRAPMPHYTMVRKPRKPREPKVQNVEVPKRVLPSLPSIRPTTLGPLFRALEPAHPIPLAEPEPLRLVDLTNGGRVTILQISDKTCKWPIGDPGDEEFCFCGHKPRDAAPYCEYHARLAYQPLQDRRPPRRPPGV